MKKKMLVSLFLVALALLGGCFKDTNSDVISKVCDKINQLNSYYLDGKLELYTNEDTYTYDVKVQYQKDNNFNVNLNNTINNHEQIILRNKDGVYVLTPSLNKSFKFQSEWPYNNSQSYLLQSIVKDIESDENASVTFKDDMYIIKTNVSYPNNKELVSQNIYVDKDMNIKEVCVMDSLGNIGIKMTFNSILENKNISLEEFTLENNMNTEKTSEEVSKIDNIIYPLYIPNNTYLSTQETVEIDNGERVILTFAGDYPFVLIQETAKIDEELQVTPVYGDPYLFTDSVGTISDKSVSWISNGIEYYVTSNVLDEEQLLTVAESIGTLPVALTK